MYLQIAMSSAEWRGYGVQSRSNARVGAKSLLLMSETKLPRLRTRLLTDSIIFDMSLMLLGSNNVREPRTRRFISEPRHVCQPSLLSIAVLQCDPILSP